MSLFAASSVSAAAAGESANVVFPTWFTGHGAGPCFYLDAADSAMLEGVDKHSRIAKWYSGAASELGFVAGGKYGKPKALLVISGHWESDEVDSAGKPVLYVSSQSRHESLLYDYYGMPPESYDITYPAPGSPKLAEQVIGLLKAAGISCEADRTRNLDHGVFVPMKLVFPAADIPIVQLSMASSMSPQFHMSVGAAIAPLRRDGVLIVGSGMIGHGREALFAGKSKMSKFIDAMEEIITEQGKKRTEEQRMKEAAEWKKMPQASAAHPREDHLIPLYSVLGAAGGKPGRSLIADAYVGKRMCLPMHNYLFGESS